jgi:hypothetical protein
VVCSPVVQGLDLVGDLAELGVEVVEVRDASGVGAEQLAVGLTQAGAGKVGVGPADDDRSGGARVAHRELEGDLAAVAPAGDDRPVQLQRGDQRREVVGERGKTQLSRGVGGAAVSTTIRCNHAELVGQQQDHRGPLDTRTEPAVDEHERRSGSVFLDVELGSVDLQDPAG